jgi:hypothetical protein
MNSGPPIRRESRTNQSAGSLGSASIPPRIATLKWHPKDEPVPAGWRVAEQLLTHHHRYSILIEQVDA